MSEPIKKAGKTPESYTPKKPEIVSMMDEAERSMAQQTTTGSGLKEEKMKKIIEITTNPNGWEYWYFPSCFASVWMRIEGVTADRQNVITRYAVVSGISHVQLDVNNEEHNISGIGYKETVAIDEYDDYVKFTMGFAGYTYERYEKGADKATVFAAIKKSIDADRPALMNFGAHYHWCVIIGYDDEDGTLYGVDYADEWRKYWKDKPGAYENGMFVTGHWYEYMTDAVVVTGKTAPAVTYDDLFRRIVNIMETMEKTGYVMRFADYLRNTVNFEGYDDEKYINLSGRIDTLIALLIDQRSWVKNFFNNMAKDESFNDKAQYFRRIAALYSSSADVCWLVWRMVGAFAKTPELDTENCAKLLASPIYRNAIADAIKVIIGNDRHILDCLKEMMGTDAAGKFI